MSVPHEHLLQFLLLLALIIAAAKAGGWASLRMGQPAVLGEAMAGVLLGSSALDLLNLPVFRGANLGVQAGFREEIEHKLREFIYAVLVPVFFISIGLQTDVSALGIDDVPFALLVIGAAIVGKIIGCGAGALAGGFTPPEALRIGVGMVSCGEVGLIVATVVCRLGC